MSDEIATQFQTRRPMLQHVADAMRDEIAELLLDEHVLAHVEFSVVTRESFLLRLKERGGAYQSPLVEMPDQVSGTIEVAEFGQVARVETLLGELLTVHSPRWIPSENGRPPVLQLTCVIPPQAMPEGWRSRADVPTVFQVNVATADKPHPPKPDSMPLLLYPGDGNAPFPLIMKGGGIKGLAYVGAIEELSSRYHFNWFVGTSAGAITAILLGAGYTPQELRELMEKKNFRDFFDASWWAKPYNLVVHHGIHHAETFTAWLDEVLAKKLRSQTRVKLSDLPNRVTVYACRRGQQTVRFDSRDNDADAAYAARCSMSIPWVFTPQTDQGINTYDGGIRQNYPVEQLLNDHPNTPFISLYLGSETYEPIRQRFVLSDLISISTEGSDAETVSKYRAQTVIIDPRPIGTLDFDLSDDEKAYLLACGRAGALSHLSDGSIEHIDAQRSRDELKAKVEVGRSLKHRKRWIRRGLKILAALTIGLVLYAAYRILR